MDDSDLLAFTPVPVRARADGWTPERQGRFIQLLSKGYRPGPAAAQVGMSRQTAYALRARPGAESFAAAWDAAFAIAARWRAARRPPSDWERAIEGVPHPVRYRGRILAWDRRHDERALLRLLRHMDRLIEKHGEGG
jgi:hypothetical protein